MLVANYKVLARGCQARPYRRSMVSMIRRYTVADLIFENRRLAEIYNPLDGDRRDLDAYMAMAAESSARSVLDIGCGTGTFACLLAETGREVIAVDPAAASLEVARRKPFAERVRWIEGDAQSLPTMQGDLATMTANVAQVFLTDEAWTATLVGVRGALRPNGGRLAFEVRDPAAQAWHYWNRDQTYRRLDLPSVGGVETWEEVTDVSPPLVSFRHVFHFDSDGATLMSESTLRFRPREEIESSLDAAGLVVEDVRGAPDRPGLEFVFIARRP